MSHTARSVDRRLCPHNPMRYLDVQDRQQVWRSLHLTALNTWSRPHSGQLATLVFGDANEHSYSQIDFVMIRSHHVTDQAKTSHVLADFPVAGWRDGTRHCPVFALLPTPRACWSTKARSTQAVQIDREWLLRDLRLAEPTLTLQALQAEVEANLTQPIETFNQVLLRAGERRYPLRRAPANRDPGEQCEEMWGLFREMRQQRLGVVTAWQQWARFIQAHRIHKARSQERSKQRRISLLEQAQQAGDRGDAHGLSKVVKQLAPKAPRIRKLQLRRNDLGR